LFAHGQCSHARYDEPLAVELTATLKQGDVERLIGKGVAGHE
jgi:hypothetical protein